MMHRLLSVTTNRLLACAAPRTRGVGPHALSARGYAASTGKIPGAPMVSVAGEEMTRYTMEPIRTAGAAARGHERVGVFRPARRTATTPPTRC